MPRRRPRPRRSPRLRRTPGPAEVVSVPPWKTALRLSATPAEDTPGRLGALVRSRGAALPCDGPGPRAERSGRDELPRQGRPRARRRLARGEGRGRRPEGLATRAL